jgi:hypothetical protein
LESVVWAISTWVGVVDWDTQSSLDVRAIKVADIIVWWERIWVDRSDVVIVPPRKIRIWAFNVIGCYIGVGADLVHCCIVAGVFWVAGSSGFLALDDTLRRIGCR